MNLMNGFFTFKKITNKKTQMQNLISKGAGIFLNDF